MGHIRAPVEQYDRDGNGNLFTVWAPPVSCPGDRVVVKDSHASSVPERSSV